MISSTCQVNANGPQGCWGGCQEYKKEDL